MSNILMRAEYACDYVSNTLRLKCANRPEGINRNHDEYNQIRTRLFTARELMHDFTNNYWKDITEVESIEVQAEMSQSINIGMCDEVSAIVFNYLQNKGERGMAIMEICGVHRFVIMGLTIRPHKIQYFIIDGTPPKYLGKDAVVCDPWYHDSFYIDVDWKKKIGIMLRNIVKVNPIENHKIKMNSGEQGKIICKAYI